MLTPMAAAAELAPGLYVVATPIGNLEDITLRALRVLKSADLIACEDTRQTHKLLSHYDITTPSISYHEHNEAERAAELVEKLKSGARIALVSDAGMPAISDPGYRVVRAAIAAGVAVVPIPGASALVSALAAAGLPTDSFRFHGFLPAKSGQRRSALEALRASQSTEVFYEAPHRIEATLADTVAVLGASRPVVIARELTKLHEEFLRGTAAELLERVRARPLRGEITLLIGKGETLATRPAITSLSERVAQFMRDHKMDEKSALKSAAKEFGLSRSEAYRELQRARR
jgi:16S rRNA (cytidine1402-2'-O)-methyltransferase